MAPTATSKETRAPTSGPAAPRESAPSNSPVASFRFRGVSASVFENRMENDQSFCKVSLTRTYRDDDGAFKSTSAFGRDDLPVVAHVANLAWQWILNHEANQRTAESTD